LPSFILSNSSYQLSNISIQQKLTPYYKLFIVTLPVPFVDKLITPSFVIIIAAAFWVHKQGIDSRAINSYSTQRSTEKPERVRRGPRDGGNTQPDRWVASLQRRRQPKRTLVFRHTLPRFHPPRSLPAWHWLEAKLCLNLFHS